MAVQIYPSNLPLPVNSNIWVRETNNINSIPLAKGSPVVYLKYPASSLHYDVEWNFSAQELRAFMGFYDLILNKGTEWFTMPVQWLVLDSEIVKQQTCNFYGNGLNVTNNGTRRIVNSSLTIKDPSRVVTG
jgi:hypothetical protein